MISMTGLPCLIHRPHDRPGVPADLEELLPRPFRTQHLRLAEECPQGLLCVVRVDCHVGTELLGALGIPARVIQAETPLPEEGAPTRILLQRLVKQLDALLDLIPGEPLHPFRDKHPARSRHLRGPRKYRSREAGRKRTWGCGRYRPVQEQHLYLQAPRG